MLIFIVKSHKYHNDSEIPAMPKINNTDYTCFLCGSQANYISFNSKKYRCVDKVTQCPGFISKAEASRQRSITPEQRKSHMRLMSTNGNSKLKELHKDVNWRKTKGKNITSGKIENGSAIDPVLKSNWKLYEDAVDRITRDSWIYYQSTINPDNLIRGNNFELDHKYSKQQGFCNKIPAEIIGHYSNLCMIEKTANRKKYNKCSITVDQLYAGFHSTMPSDSPSSDIVIS